MADIDDIIHDIRDALTEAQRVDMDDRLAKASDMQARIGVLMRMSWQAKGAPMLAQRVIDWSNHIRPHCHLIRHKRSERIVKKIELRTALQSMVISY
jgi:hypothetical protein